MPTYGQVVIVEQGGEGRTAIVAEVLTQTPEQVAAELLNLVVVDPEKKSYLGRQAPAPARLYAVPREGKLPESSRHWRLATADDALLATE